MARRGSNPTPETPETNEAPVEEQTTNEAPATEEKPVDLTAFQDAANKAIEAADKSTGEVPADSLAAVNEVYREIDGIKGKNAARAWLDEQMKKAIGEDKDIVKARATMSVKDNLSAGSSSGTKAPADPTQAFVQKVVGLQLALQLVTGTVPEGVAEDWAEQSDKLAGEVADQVTAFGAWQASDAEDKGEAPEVAPVVRQAFKLASGRGAGGGGSRVSGGPRRDIEKHLTQVFADQEPGSFLTVNEIAKAHSEEYGDDRPSAGAVSARLFPKGKDPYSANGISAVAEEGKPKGARKDA